jgi:CHAT domain-containing protein
MHFDRLPDTREEADTIEKILHGRFGQKVFNEQDKRALELVLFRASSPKVLHLATHGYFLAEEEAKQSEKTAELPLTGDPLEDTPATIENPMLRSGIVLAGANTSLKEGKDEGMVTAEKVLGLNLRGTDLVVLSACQTGVGDIQSGEGVFGLKRAFILSGAKTLVMSLWSVPSKETVDLMTAFYALLSDGKTPAEALRQAKLNLMKQKPHPFFWAAFVLTGSP